MSNKFLIIDDSYLKIEKIKDFLKESNLEFDLAETYESAIKKILKNKYCAIFLDMNFPISDNEWESNTGLMLLEKLQEENICIPIAIHSSKYVDVSKFENVKDYIIYDCSDVYDKKIEMFINKFK